jgi:hypothetical protein
MPQIIYKLTDEGRWCLYDTKSEQFFEGGYTRSLEDSQETLGLANSIANKSARAIMEIAQQAIYNDGDGYLPYMIAKSLIKFDPSIKERVNGKLNKPRINKKMTRTSKVRMRRTEKVEKPVPEGTVKRGRGRPRKNPV